MSENYVQPYGLPTVWILDGRGLPEVSPLGAGAIYFDEATNRFMVSENGGAYVQLVGGGGATLQSAYDAGPSIAVGAGGPVAVGNAAGQFQPALSVTQSEPTEPALSVEGATEAVGQATAPDPAPAGSGRTYYDPARGLFLGSQEAGAYRPFVVVPTDFVYRPGDPSPGPNVYTSWADLVDALNAPEALNGLRVITVLDDLAPAIVPAGAWTLQGPGQVAMRGYFARPPLGTRTNLEFQDGATLSFQSVFLLTDFVAWVSTSTSPVITVSPGDGGAALVVEMGAAVIASGAAPFISVQDPASTNLLAVRTGAVLTGSGGQPVIDLAVAGSTLILSVVDQGVVEASAVSGDAGAVMLQQVLSGAQFDPNQPGFLGFTIFQALCRYALVSLAGDLAVGPVTYPFPFGASVVGGDASGGAVDVELPPVAEAIGRELIVKKVDGTANAVSVVPAGAETIDGVAAPYVMTVANEYVRLVGAPVGWFVIGG